jgi:hypothetical protein
MPNKPHAIKKETELLSKIILYEAIYPAMHLCEGYEFFHRNDNLELNIESKCTSLTLCLAIAYEELRSHFSDHVDISTILDDFLHVYVGFYMNVKKHRLNSLDKLSLKIKQLDMLGKYIDMLRESNINHLRDALAFSFLPALSCKYSYNYFEEAITIIVNQERLLIRMFLHDYLDFQSHLHKV